MAEHLRIGEIARRSGVGRGTIQHYLREGLLPKPVKTFRNMAYYDPACIERIKLIKELQENNHLPLSEIRKLFARGRDKTAFSRALVEAQQAALRSVSPATLGTALTPDAAAKTFGLDRELVSELAELGLIGIEDGVIGGIDLDVLAAVANLKQTGLSREAGFDARDLAMYRRALDTLLEQEVRTFLKVLSGGRAKRPAPELARAAVEGATLLLVALRKKSVFDLLRSLGPELEKAEKERVRASAEPAERQKRERRAQQQKHARRRH